ncbi:hypothetical protein HYPSUDRAFT_210199, partial [Hypholoma sublateritium FD-334 SS-4]
GNDAASPGSESCSRHSNPPRASPRSQTTGASASTATNTAGGGRYNKDSVNGSNYFEDPSPGAVHSTAQKARSAASSTAHSSGGGSYYQDTARSETCPAQSGAYDSLTWGFARCTSESVGHEPIHPELACKTNQGILPDPAASSTTNNDRLAVVDVPNITLQPVLSATSPSHRSVRRFPARRSTPVQCLQRTPLAQSHLKMSTQRLFPRTIGTLATKSSDLAPSDMPSFATEPIPGPKFPSHFCAPGLTASSRSAPIITHREAIPTHVTSSPCPRTSSTAPEYTNGGQAVAMEPPRFSSRVFDGANTPTFAAPDSSIPSRTQSSCESYFQLERDTQPTSFFDYCTVPGESPILTPELIALGEEAIATYELLHAAQVADLPPDENDRSPRLFSSLSREGIERHFNALVDARDAIQLRRLAVSVDIGECLKVLDSKLSMYSKDGVFLSSAAYEILLIKAESATRQLDINFYGLEVCRSKTRNPPYGSSFMEQHSNTNTSINLALQMREDAYQATDIFVDDPCALTEHRLPFFNFVQR